MVHVKTSIQVIPMDSVGLVDDSAIVLTKEDMEVTYTTITFYID
jgi:hypothetical protein